MKDLNIDDINTWPELKPVDLADMPALNAVYENAREEHNAKTRTTGQYDEFSTLKHINPELAGRVW